MKGLHVDDSAFFHLDIPSLNSVSKFAASSALEHSNQGVFSYPAKQEELHKFQNPQASYKPSSFAERKKTRGLDCFGNLMCNLEEVNNCDVNDLGNMIVPGGEKMKNIDDSVSRNMGGDDTEGGLVGDLQASMDAVKGAHMPGFKYYTGIERSDYGSPIAPIMGRHSSPLKDFMGNDQGSYVDDSQASTMFALSCMSPSGDHSFWRFLPSNHEEHTTDFFSSDEFRMYEFKVRKCMRGRSHDWTECPFAHPGEKARRRDPRRFHYSGTACPDFRRGTCRRGDSCELSHGVFECWLHPARYRTQLCKDGKSCKRRVCFFAHSSAQLRYVSPDPFPESGLALKSHLASPTDAMSGYADVPYKLLPFFAKNSSPVGQGMLDGNVGDMFLDDFSPIRIPDFPHDGFCPLDVHSKSIQNDRNFNGRNNHGHGLSIGDLSSHLKLNSHSYRASGDVHLLDELNHEGIHGHNFYPYPLGNPPSDISSFKASQPHVNLRNQLALASLANNIDQIVSPTSTLNMGHVFSPPPLSPPLSPSESPSISLGTAFSALSRKVPSLSGQPQSQGLASSMDANPLIADGTSPSATQFQASLLASLGAPLFVNPRGPSPLSTNSLEDKRHDLERCNSMPQTQELIEDGGLQMSSLEAYPGHAMAHLISTLQQMELRHAMMDAKSTRSSYMSHSNPNTPKPRDSWDVNSVASHRRVESGQGLRGKIYGKLGKEAAIDIENPDFAWVNELVK